MQNRFSKFCSALLSVEPRKGRFFRPIDWTGFWTATLASFAVYFFTLGPSVGLEDSGELATAGDHLGVPHPPGYPFWTLCSWIFCRIFSFVTYQGQPTPAWAISCLSAVFGALAAGSAAMLITRSASDWLDGSGSASPRANGLIGLSAGLGGALVFAFSPVEWSQSTIVEIYSLNALFLMAVFLLSYRWMRRQSDKVLWLTAFVFGLGLTNYQVLLFAIVPLAIIIFLRNIRLFRDVAAIAVPLALTLFTLSTASLDRATREMDADVIAKHLPAGDTRVVTRTFRDTYFNNALVDRQILAVATNDTSKLSRADLEKLPPNRIVYDDNGQRRRTWQRQSVETTPRSANTPYSPLLWLGFALVALSPFLSAIPFLKRAFSKSDNLKTRQSDNPSGRSTATLALALSGAALVALSVFVTHSVSWAKEWEAPLAPLADPRMYAFLGAILAASAAFALACAIRCRESDSSPFDPQNRRLAIAAAAAGALAVAIAFFQPAAGTAGYAGKLHKLGLYSAFQVLGVATLFLLTAWTRRGILFAIPVAAVQLSAMFLTLNGSMNGLTHPQSWWFFWPVVWNFIALALAYFTLPNGKSVAPAFFFGELGVSFYAYMPIVSDLRNPPMNWGYPRTWDGFKHALTRGQYEAISFSDTFLKLFTKAGLKEFAAQIGNYCQDLRLQFTLVAAALALLPFTLWRLTIRTANRLFTFNAFAPAIALYAATAALVTVFSEFFKITPDGEVPFRLDKWALLALGLLALAGLVAILVSVLISALRAAGIVSREKDFSSFPVKISFGADGVLKEWLVASGACFAVMSFILIALAKTKGDVQDGFIQKVKFISSHGIFSLWIGYGLALGIAFMHGIAKKLFAKRPAILKTVFAALLAGGALVAAIPIYENYTNDRLVFEMGSAEQNGHTFGWQFGNYQLRGAAAIREELSADEEPLPNPLYPPEMGQGAIFFGGTDPGRFVPTYMIYSARVRPDIYLITQNALADETYMSVERDLYGDEIWIPSREDASNAFAIYVDEVKTGKREPNPGLSFINGKVQVVGASGVMEINGIITEMMFAKERRRRDFYVEESYAIPWMYPYLEPHGLIMRIAPEKSPIPGRLARNDMDFWDWYRRRLMRDRAFRRDFPAQKAFSKLRAAIAGLYTKRGWADLGAQAFREAYILYPASPEAAFRYIQEILLPRGSWHAIRDILDYTDAVDPNNIRTQRIREVVDRVIATEGEIAKILEKERREGQLSLQDLLQLSKLYVESGVYSKARARLKEVLSAPGAESAWQLLYTVSELQSAARADSDAADTMLKCTRAMPRNTPPAFRVSAATVLHRAGKLEDALAQISTAIDASPRDARAWLVKARILAELGRTEEARAAIDAARAIDPKTASAIIAQDPVL